MFRRYDTPETIAYVASLERMVMLLAPAAGVGPYIPQPSYRSGYPMPNPEGLARLERQLENRQCARS